MKKKMSKRLKKILDSSKDKKIEKIEDAIKKVKVNCSAKFDESIDVSFNLNLKNKKDDVSLRTIVKLPNGNGKKIKIAVLCEEGKTNEAKDSGADFYNSESLINDITSGKINFDKLVATPAMMPKMGKLGKILGPKGLMPNPKFGTVTNDIKSIVKSLNLLLAPITEISVYLLEALLTETLGSILAKSPIDLLIVGTASISTLVRRVPDPVFTITEPAAAVTTSSSASDLARLTETLSVSFSDK